MVWTNAGVISPSRNWQYTNVVEGDFFRLSHNYSDLPTEYFQAELTQIEEGEDGAITTFGHQVIEASPTSEVIQLTKPDCFTNRKIAIRQLSRDIDLPPAGRVYSWAIGIEVYDPNEAPPPPPPPGPMSAAGVEYACSQSGALDANGTGSYAKLTDGSADTAAMTNNGASWIQATFETEVIVSAVTVAGGSYPGFGGMGFALFGAQLQHSIDGLAWTSVVEINGVADSGADQFKKFTLPTPVTAKFWRLRRDGFLGTGEFKLE